MRLRQERDISKVISLSPLLFVVAMIPLTMFLRREDMDIVWGGAEEGQPLLSMDDFGAVWEG